MSPAVRALRAHAIAGSLGTPDTLDAAVARMGFVQFDPIRRPARADDLILHQRVRGHREEDLGRAYDRLGLDEDYLHVYGAMTPAVRTLLHPRPDREHPGRPYAPTGLAAEVLAEVRRRGATHPRDLDELSGRAQAVNAWGGTSSAATRALERLHHHGLLRVVRRESGTKVYEASLVPPHDLSPEDRLRGIVQVLVALLAPISERSLGGVLSHVRRVTQGLPVAKGVVQGLLASGALEAHEVDGVRYLSPAGTAALAWSVPPRRVRLLAPFDPVVWDRARFEHLWGWPYRFEAYTPAAKRQLGYYALPLLVGDRVIGWATFARDGDRLLADVGFAGRAPTDRKVHDGIAGEVARLERMLRPRG